MYSDWSVLALVVVAAVFVWLGILSLLILQQGRFLRSLFPSSGERDIRKKFKETVEIVGDFKKRLNALDGKVEAVQNQGFGHIQRVGLLRFNPYDDTGGDQSFSVALLDKKGSGIVVTSLHARSGTRVFAKDINSGKSSKYQLSKEEEAVIKKAMEV